MTNDDVLSSFVRRLAAHETLDAEEATFVFTAMMEGAVSPVRMAAVLTAMAVRGPSAEEIVGGALALRAHALKVAAPAGAIDLCGTGGDNHGTLNISTAVSFVVAACGVPVAKHGNRAMSSRTGAADVLEALGVSLSLKPDGVEACMREAGIGFLFAQAHHPAMRHVGPVRKELGFRTIFNLLGTLSNPAGVKRQLLGVYELAWVEPVARTLQMLGAEKAWVVHGADGLDEISISGPTDVAALEHGKIRCFRLTPDEVGLPRAPLSAIKGATREENAAAIRALFAGARGAFRDIVVLNAAAALIVADKCNSMRDGAGMAMTAIDSGGAAKALDTLISVSNRWAA